MEEGKIRAMDQLNENNNLHWYAVKVFKNLMTPIRRALEEDKVCYFIPSEVITSLALVHCTEEYIKVFEQYHFSQLWVYSTRGPKRMPLMIPDQEVEIFMFVCTSGQQGLTFLGDDKPEYHMGDRVRVTDGPFKGAEGHIKRIKKDRRLIVSIHGVAAVATAFIHPQFLEVINE